MNKILNWTFGSIFRTIGRIIAYILVGALAWFFISGLDLSDWRDKLIISPIQNWRWVSLPKVYAAEYQDGFDTRYYYDENLTSVTPYNGWYDYMTKTSVNSPNGSISDAWFYLNPMMPVSHIRTGEITIPIYVSTPVVASTTTSTIYAQDYCDRWEWASIDSYNNVTKWNCESVGSGQDSTLTDREYLTPQLTISAFVLYDSGYLDICSVDMSKNLLTCPIANYSTVNNVKAINIMTRVFYSTSSNTYNYYVGLFRKINRYSNSTQAIIDNQNQNAQQQHQDSQQATSAIESQTQQQHQDSQALNETITDDTPPDVSSALDNDTVAGWLPPGPIDSLVNLPLTLFNSLTNAMGGTCGALTVPLPFVDKNISIPCMSNVYGSMGFSSFFNWIGVISSAFILFSYLMKLYKWVDDTLTFRENNHLDNWGGV